MRDFLKINSLQTNKIYHMNPKLTSKVVQRFFE